MGNLFGLGCNSKKVANNVVKHPVPQKVSIFQSAIKKNKIIEIISKKCFSNKTNNDRNHDDSDDSEDDDSEYHEKPTEKHHEEVCTCFIQ